MKKQRPEGFENPASNGIAGPLSLCNDILCTPPSRPRRAVYGTPSRSTVAQKTFQKGQKQQHLDIASRAQ